MYLPKTVNCLYVGYTGQACTRFANHHVIWPARVEPADLFEWYACENWPTAFFAETPLIRALIGHRMRPLGSSC